jgi:dihydrofolate reductase/thymidylate synthase
MKSSVKMPFTILAAVDIMGGIGQEGKLPWPRLRNKSRNDLQEFRQLTSGSIIIMGYRTYYSLPKRPLPDRVNLVIARKEEKDLPSESPHFVRELHSPHFVQGLCPPHFVSSLNEALLFAEQRYPKKPIYVIGGEQIYRQAINHRECCTLRLTRVHSLYPCDRFFPDIPTGYHRMSSKDVYLTDLGVYVSTEIWQRSPERYHDEKGYLALVNDVLTTGVTRDDRTGVGTLSIFGPQMVFELEDQFPLLTTKRTFFKGIAEELIWFMSGSTKESDLAAKGVHIWKANALDAEKKFPGRDNLGPGFLIRWGNCL